MDVRIHVIMNHVQQEGNLPLEEWSFGMGEGGGRLEYRSGGERLE